MNRILYHCWSRLRTDQCMRLIGDAYVCGHVVVVSETDSVVSSSHTHIQSNGHGQPRPQSALRCALSHSLSHHCSGLHPHTALRTVGTPHTRICAMAATATTIATAGYDEELSPGMYDIVLWEALSGCGTAVEAAATVPPTTQSHSVQH